MHQPRSRDALMPGPIIPKSWQLPWLCCNFLPDCTGEAFSPVMLCFGSCFFFFLFSAVRLVVALAVCRDAKFLGNVLGGEAGALLNQRGSLRGLPASCNEGWSRLVFLWCWFKVTNPSQISSCHLLLLQMWLPPRQCLSPP